MILFCLSLHAQTTYEKNLEQLQRDFYMPRGTAPMYGYRTLEQKEKELYRKRELGEDIDFYVLVPEYKKLIAQFKNVYTKNGFPVKFTGDPNYVSGMLKALISLFLDDINRQAGTVQLLLGQKKPKEDPYKILHNLTDLLRGNAQATEQIEKDGYIKTILDLAGTTFGQPEEQNAAKKYFYDGLGVLFDVYTQVLSSYIQIQEPTNEQLVYADLFYKQYADQFRYKIFLKQATQTSANTIMASIAQGIAMLFIRATSLLQVKMLEKTEKENKPNREFLKLLYKQVALYFNQAAGYFERLGMGNEQANAINYAQRYETYLKNYNSALTTLAKADTLATTDLSQAITTYKKAEKLFKLAQAAADLGTTQKKRYTLQSQYAIGTGQKVLQDFVVQNDTKLKNYYAYISAETTDQPETFANFVQLFNDQIAAEQAARSQYSDARSAFIELEEPFVVPELAIEVLTTTTRGYETLLGADKLSVQTDKSPYRSARIQFQKADRIYSKDSKLVPYIPQYPRGIADQTFLSSGQVWNYDTAVARHIASKYVQAADGLAETDLFSAYSYYAYALNQGLLAPKMKTYITNQLAKLKVGEDTLIKQFAKNQQLEKEAQSLTVKDWEPDPQQLAYTSSADVLWQTVCQGYMNLYRMGYADAGPAYAASMQSYAQAYEKNVPDYLEPSLQAGLLHYQIYLFQKDEADKISAFTTSTQQGAIDLAEKSLKTFFEALQKLVTAVDVKNVRVSFVDDMKRVTFIQNELEQAIAQDQTTMSTPVLSVVKKDEATQVYTVTLPGKEALSATITDPQKILADLYAALGQDAFEKNDFITAKTNFEQARSRYLQTGAKKSADALTINYELSRVRSIAQELEQAVVTVGSKQVPQLGVTVPQSYKLKFFQQVIPSDVTIPATVNSKIQLLTRLYALKDKALLSEQQKEIQREIDAVIATLQLDLAAVARDLYLRNMTVYQGIDYTLVKQQNFASLSNEQQELLLELISEAKAFQATFADRIKKKEAPFGFIVKDGKNQIVIKDYPIPALDIRMAGKSTTLLADAERLPYHYLSGRVQAVYPTVFFYNTLAWNYYRPRDAKTWAVGTKVYVSGDDKTSADRVMETIGKAFVNRAMVYSEAVDYMLGKTLIKPTQLPDDQIKEVVDARISLSRLVGLKSPENAQLSDYFTAYTTLKSYVVDGAVPLLLGAQQYFNKGNIKTHDAKIKTTIGNLFKNLAQEIRTKLLIGDPSDSSGYFLQVINDAINAYRIAFETYKVLDVKTTYGYLVDMWKDAGDLLVALGKYGQAGEVSSSAPYYKAQAWANTYFQKYDSKQTNAVMRQKVRDINAARLGAQYKYASTLLNKYAQDRMDVNKSGKSLATVVKNYKSDMTTDEQLYFDARKRGLDSVIYYMGVALGLGPLTKNQVDLTSTSSTLINSVAQDLVDTYTTSKKIDLVDRTQEPKKLIAYITPKDAVQKLNTIYDDLRKKAAALTKYDIAGRTAIEYKAVAKWTSILLSKVQNLIGYDFKETSAEVFTDIKNQMKRDQQNACQYVQGC